MARPKEHLVSRRTLFLYKGMIVDREKIKQVILDKLREGWIHSRIRKEVNLLTGPGVGYYDHLIREIMKESLVNEPDAPRFAIISEFPFPLHLGSEQIMERLEGPWLHACHLQDTNMETIKKKVSEMGDDYGWVKIVRLMPVDQATLVDNGGALL